MAITANTIINEAKKLNGYKASASSCTPNNWFYGHIVLCLVDGAWIQLSSDCNFNNTFNNTPFV